MRTQVMHEELIEQVEVSIETVKEVIAMRDSLIKLSKNREFKKIIETGYFTNEAARVVMGKASPEMQTPERQAAMDKQITAIGGLQQYFGMIMAMGNQAERDLEGHEATREAIQAEILEDGEEL